ncbi:helix-turn-helix transcriptional regulator [Longimicrobium sp.]|uniref:helix-turn-helix transcriptional regulator n=1 Tax=Longimicrobium sp. TaxID=2029185 RepID=UPI002E37604D|nr:helix-turn-helix domain-containing protein [Longimicrobium sp.]HEX6038079.1 helix-turn-helix domain-containing protein [Longimicrobium sp.]
MADVLLLNGAPAALDALRRALRGAAAGGAVHALRPARDWAELSALAATVAVGAAFVDPYHGGAFAAAEIRRLRARYPALELVAYTDFVARPVGDTFHLALLGVRGVVAQGGRDEAALLARCLEDTLGWTPLEALVERLGEVLPASIHRWLEPVLRSPVEPRTVCELARRAGCSARTLRRTLSAAGLPSPEQLLAWRRLLHAARLLEDAERSVESVARALEFSSGAALRRSLRALTGLRPTELAAQGGLRLLAARFLAACGDGDSEPAGRVPRPPRPVAGG